MTDSRPADWLNRDCHCLSVDRNALERSLEQALDELDADPALAEIHRHLFASSPVFLSAEHLDTMRATIAAIVRATELPAYRRWALADAPPSATIDPGPKGVFLGFDFHLTDRGPRLIEVNTNAGGALLSLLLARAQRACCAEVEPLATGALRLRDLEQRWLEMFEREWRLLGVERPLRRVAIVDLDPPSQFLYPEMRLFRRLFRRAGLEAEIVDPGRLRWDGQALRLDDDACGGKTIDLVYNRLTDFYLESPESEPLRAAWASGTVALTPHPRCYALFADKRCLVALSDPALLRDAGLDEGSSAVLAAAVPRTRTVERTDAETLWQERKELFFKPRRSHGSRGAYDGAKLTHKTFEAILAGDYVAQTKVPPSERTLVVDGERRQLKVDLRCVVYDGEVQLVTARLYRGQTTNLRTEGGGLATVFTVPAED